MDTTQQRRRMGIRQAGAAVAAVAVFGTIIVFGSTASAAATWPPSATITGGGSDYTLVVAGAVPQNCTRNGSYVEVNAGGTIGTDPTVGANGGAFSVTIANLTSSPTDIVARVMGGNKNNCPAAADVIVYEAPTWTDDVLGHGVVGSTYTDGVAADSNPDATYSVTAGTLPDGLVLDTTTGAVSGTPTTVGQSSFTITASNGQDVITKDFVLDVTAALVGPAWTDETVATTATVGTVYGDDVSASGNPAPTYSVKSGSSLPAGLVLDPTTGALSGTPTAAGANTFTLVATNSVGSIEKLLSITVSPALAAPVWTDSALASAPKVGTVYSDGVSATGYPVPTYSVTGGELPAGLSLDTATGAITGTPTTKGAKSFTVTASNSAGSVDALINTTVLGDTVTKTPTKPKTPTTPVDTGSTPPAPTDTDDGTDSGSETAAPLPKVTETKTAAPVTEVQNATATRSGATALAATGTGSGVIATWGSVLLAMGVALAVAGRRRTLRLAPVAVIGTDDDRSAPWGAVALSLVVLAIAGRKKSGQA